MMGVMATTDDWRRLARLARDRRGDLRLTQGEVSASGGPSISTLRLIEGALQPSGFRPAILRALERALQWEPGSVRAVLDGGDPTPITGDDPTLPGISPAPAAVTAAGGADAIARIQAGTFAGEMFEAAEGIKREIARRRREGVPEDRIFADEFEQELWSGTGTILTPEDQRVLAIVWLRMTRPRRPPNSDTSPPLERAG